MNQTDTAPSIDRAGHDPGVYERLANALYGRFGRRGQFWHQVRRLGTWLEHELPARQEEHDEPLGDEVSIDFDDQGRLLTFRMGKRRHDGRQLVSFRRLWSFLNWLGVRRLELATRLERNQVEDVFTFLYRHRRRLARRLEAPPRRPALKALLSDEGVHLACTRTRLVGGTLSIEYSYCALTFSKAVHWFERAHTTITDHRTFFQAAPRVGLLIALLAAGPTFLVGWYRGQTGLMVVGAIEGILLFGLSYIFFMIIGSIEYDNEEKAYRLGLAYDRLSSYADRVKSDILRARDVQQRFLPELGDGSLPTNLSWASCFMPEEAVGGDFFDVRPLDDNRIAILFSDVSGHGMSSAFISAVLKTSFQGWVDRPTDLETLLLDLNSALVRTTPDGSFAAVFVAVLDSRTGHFSYANAGHQPEPWIIPAAEGEAIRSLSEAPTMILGITDVEPVVAQTWLKPGDTFLMVSDGVVENLDVDGQIYGVDRFVRFLESRRSETHVVELMNHLTEEVVTYSQDTEPHDDRTMLAFRFDAMPTAEEAGAVPHRGARQES